MNTDSIRRRIIAALCDTGHADLACAMQETAIWPVAQSASNGDQILYDNEWLQLRETPDRYVYAHEAKGNGKGVAVLAYRNRDGVVEVAGRYERTPCHHDGFALTSLTGQMDQDEEPIDTAVRELKEEAGIDVARSEMKPLGTVRPGKQTDTTMYLFAVDVGERDIGEAVGDGTDGEVGAYCRWVSLADAALCKCPVLASLMVRSFDWF